MLAIKNGTIFTGTGDVLERGSILIRDGKIQAVGTELEIPPEAEILDASGCVVTPGLIDAHTHIGVRGEPQHKGTVPDHTEKGANPVTPHMRLLDAFQPRDIGVAAARNAGFTTCCTLPGASNVISGIGFAFKTAPRNTPDEMMIPGTQCMKFALGENPISTYGAKDKAPKTRMGVSALIRKALWDARYYSDQLREAESHGKAVKPDLALQALVPVVRGEMLCRFHCHTSADIATAIRIAREFDLKFSLEHVTEGFQLLPEIRDSGAICAVGPLVTAPSKREIWARSLTTPAAFEQGGIPFCLIQDGGVMTALLPTYIGLAIKNGLSHAAALQAVTSIPARLLGIDSRVGTLEAGKDADVAIFDGDPFSNYTNCKYTIVDGQVFPNGSDFQGKAE